MHGNMQFLTISDIEARRERLQILNAKSAYIDSLDGIDRQRSVMAIA